MKEQWSKAQAQAWYQQKGWLCGFNYLPSTAVNWTDIWQKETFDATLSTASWAGRRTRATTPCALICRLSSGRMTATG
jgi:hypothetical protein